MYKSFFKKIIFKHNKRGGTYTSPECGVNGNNVKGKAFRARKEL